MMSKHRIKIAPGNEDCELFREMFKKFKHLHKNKFSLCVQRNNVYIMIFDLDYWLIWRSNHVFEKYMIINRVPNLMDRKSISKADFISITKWLLKF